MSYMKNRYRKALEKIKNVDGEVPEDNWFRCVKIAEEALEEGEDLTAQSLLATIASQSELPPDEREADGDFSEYVWMMTREWIRGFTGGDDG